MSTKWKNNKITENLGTLFVQSLINDCKGIFNKVDGSNDVGIDGYLEFVQDESVTGLCAQSDFVDHFSPILTNHFYPIQIDHGYPA